MYNLKTKLNDMDEYLFIETSDTVGNNNSPNVFIEDMQIDIVKELIPASSFDINYSYRLMTSEEGFVVIKYDKSTLSVIEEYPIEDGLPVQSYEDMRKSTILHSNNFEEEEPLRDVEEIDNPSRVSNKFYWWFWLVLSIPFIVILINYVLMSFIRR